jgi:type I restriction enzyme S subunit
MNDQPKSWMRCTIGSLCKLINGRVFKPTDWTEKGLPIIRIQNLNDPLAPFNFFDGQVRSQFLINSGALLFAWSGTPGTSFGAHIWNGGPAVLNQHIFNVIFDEQKINKRFLQLAINQKLEELINAAHGGVGLRHVTKGRFEDTEIALPPLDVQERIVAKLDSLLGRTKKAREELSRIPRLIARHKLAILTAAIQGRTTAKWRASNPVRRSTTLIGTSTVTAKNRREGGSATTVTSRNSQLPGSWQIAAVESIGKVILGRQRSPENHNGPHMRSYVRAANITWEGWDLADVKQMNFDEQDFARFKLRPGDVLINEGSGSADEVGKPAIWNGEIDNCCFQNTLIAVRPHATTAEFLYFVLLNAALSKAFVDETRGVNIHHIGRAGLAQYVIPVPPVEEQHEIVRGIKAAVKKSSRLGQEVMRAIELVDRLEQAALGKAFRGELRQRGLAAEQRKELAVSG